MTLLRRMKSNEMMKIFAQDRTREDGSLFGLGSSSIIVDRDVMDVLVAHHDVIDRSCPLTLDAFDTRRKRELESACAFDCIQDGMNRCYYGAVNK